MQKQIQELADNFFKLMQVEITSLEVKTEDEERKIYFINLQTPDSKLVIGLHGQTLESIKQLLTRMIETSVGEVVVLHLEVNDYLKSKDEKLFRYIDGRIDYVIKYKKEITLGNLTSYERKKVHSYISDKKLKNIKSYSIGEGKDRFMHLAPVLNENISNIDIDGLDI